MSSRYGRCVRSPRRERTDSEQERCPRVRPSRRSTLRPVAPWSYIHHLLFPRRFQRGFEETVALDGLVRSNAAQPIAQQTSTFGDKRRPHLEEAVREAE